MVLDSCSLQEDLMRKQCTHLRIFGTLPIFLTRSKKARKIMATISVTSILENVYMRSYLLLYIVGLVSKQSNFWIEDLSFGCLINLVTEFWIVYTRFFQSDICIKTIELVVNQIQIVVHLSPSVMPSNVLVL